jgi:hypothetical protein
MFDCLPFIAGGGPLGARAGLTNLRRADIPEHDRQKRCESDKSVDKSVAPTPTLAIMADLIREMGAWRAVPDPRRLQSSLR